MCGYVSVACSDVALHHTESRADAEEEYRTTGGGGGRGGGEHCVEP